MRIKKNNIYYSIVIIYTLLMSGSFIAHSYSDVLTKINMIVSVGVILAYCRRNGFTIRRDIVTLFAAITILDYIIRIIYWNEFSSFTGYLGDICILLVYIIIGSAFDYSLFIIKYNKILRVLTIASLVGHAFYSALIRMPVPVIGNTWKYHFFGLFALREGSSVRNSGIFWEPGMFQGFLVFGLLLIILKRKKEVRDWIDVTLYVIAIITTESTTGYFLLVLLLMLFILISISPQGVQIKQKKTRKILQRVIIAFSILFAVIVLLNEDILYEMLTFFPEDVVGKLIDPTNISTNSRIYGMLYDVMLSMKYPFGVGRNSMKELWGVMMSQYGVEVIGRTSAWSTAFVYSGIFGGIMYISLWVSACIRFQRRDGIRILYTILIMAIILNTEPHYATLFFNTIAVMWCRQIMQDDNDIMGKENVADHLSA